MPYDHMAKSEKFFQNLKARGYRLWLYLLFYLSLWLSARHIHFAFSDLLESPVSPYFID